MDLKSMLNESSTTATSQSASQIYQAPSRQQTYPPYQRERPQQPPPLQPPQGSQSVMYGSQSASHPYPASSGLSDRNSSHSTLVFSPGQHTTPRDGSSYHHPTPEPPSLSASSASQHSSQAAVPQYQQTRPPTGLPGGSLLASMVSRDDTLSASPHSSTRHFSPRASHPSLPTTLPGTPLGPPVPIQRQSPQTNQRALSYGTEHARTHSGSSLGPPSHEMDSSTINPNRTPSRESGVRHYSYERERQQSMSVSPKTIPQPSPLRQASAERSQSYAATPPSKLSDQSDLDGRARSSLEPQKATSQRVSPAPSRETEVSPQSSFRQSPRPPIQYPIPTSNSTTASAQVSLSQRQPALKRNASAIEDPSRSPQPKKRSKRSEIPIFARSARPSDKRPLRYRAGDHSNAPLTRPPANGHSLNGAIKHAPSASVAVAPAPVVPIPSAPGESLEWEPSITGVIPHEDLTNSICDTIINAIGRADPPSEGAHFEIEAKLGEIVSLDTGMRLSLPVLTETILNKASSPPVRFQSSMDLSHHQAMNKYLNGVYFAAIQPNRIPISPAHIRETDAFYSLTPAGESALPSSISRWLHRKHRPRVRITTFTSQDPEEAQPTTKTRQIVKTRVADIDVLCPGLRFDYRVSINLESPWDGDAAELIRVNDAGPERGPHAGGQREKDRMSYRHLAFQIDLTQVSYPGSAHKEHELEVEISPIEVAKHLGMLHDGLPNRYQEIVRCFLDNVRILAREASAGGKGR